MTAMKRHILLLFLTAIGCAWILPAKAQLQDERNQWRRQRKLGQFPAKHQAEQAHRPGIRRYRTLHL